MLRVVEQRRVAKDWARSRKVTLSKQEMARQSSAYIKPELMQSMLKCVAQKVLAYVGIYLAKQQIKYKKKTKQSKL